MSANSIFVCHDCREAEESSYQYPGALGRKGIFSLTLAELKEGEYADRYRDMEEWIAEHLGHDAEMHSDAHGCFSAAIYDFDTRAFGYDPYK